MFQVQQNRKQKFMFFYKNAITGDDRMVGTGNLLHTISLYIQQDHSAIWASLKFDYKLKYLKF